MGRLLRGRQCGRAAPVQMRPRQPLGWAGDWASLGRAALSLRVDKSSGCTGGGVEHTLFRSHCRTANKPFAWRGRDGGALCLGAPCQWFPVQCAVGACARATPAGPDPGSAFCRSWGRTF